MEHIKDNEELYRAWIGTKKQDEYILKMKKGGFSWGAFFLSDLLLLTRKMFIETVILILVDFFIIAVLEIMGVSEMMFRITVILTRIVLGFSYYNLYRWNIERKIEKYKRKGLTYEEQLKIAEKYGGDGVTISVIVMFLILIVLFVFLYSGMILTLNIVENSNQIINNEKNNEINYDPNNGHDLFNNDISENYNSNNKTWSLESFSLSYNSNDWKEITSSGYKTLKYKNTDNYLTYIGSTKSNGLKDIKERSKKEEFKMQLKNDLQKNSSDIIYLNSECKDVNSKLFLCKIECMSNIYNQYIKYNYYYYFSDNKTYYFMVTEADSDYSFIKDSESVLDTIKNNYNI